MAEGKLVKISELEAFIPAGHTNTEAWAVINNETVEAKLIKLVVTEICAGGEAEEAAHAGAEHGYFMLSGVGEAFVEGKKCIINPNECLWIPPGAKHKIKPVGKEAIRFIVFTARHPA